MKKIYIVHPLRGKQPYELGAIERNIKRVDEICRTVAANHPDVLILSPIHAFGFSSALGSQDWAFDQCEELLSLADEAWLFGNWLESEGCMREVAFAREHGIPLQMMERCREH